MCRLAAALAFGTSHLSPFQSPPCLPPAPTQRSAAPGQGTHTRRPGPAGRLEAQPLSFSLKWNCKTLLRLTCCGHSLQLGFLHQILGWTMVSIRRMKQSSTISLITKQDKRDGTSFWK